MRMWNVNPKFLCKKHLLGEHVEMHMFVGAINHNKSMNGFVQKQLVNTSLIQKRHDELSKEIEKRGYNHKSPLIYIDTLNAGTINVEANVNELHRRCELCRERINKSL